MGRCPAPCRVRLLLGSRAAAFNDLKSNRHPTRMLTALVFSIDHQCKKSKSTFNQEVVSDMVIEKYLKKIPFFSGEEKAEIIL